MKKLYVFFFCGLICAATCANAQQTWDCGATPGTVSGTLTPDGTLTITGIGPMPDYNSGAPWYSVRTNIKSLVVGGGVTYIGNYSFDGCTALTTVTMQDGTGTLTLPNVSPSRVFQNCPVETLYLGRNITGVSPFQNNTTLETVTVGGYVTTLNSYQFSGCIRLSAVNINVSSVTLGTFTFQNCQALTDDVVNEILKKTGAIPADTFTGCTGLTHVIIPNTLTSIGQSAFNACSKLTAVTIQDGTNTLDVGNISPNRIFYDCPIKTLYFGRNFNVTYSSPFQSNTTLETVTVGGYVTTLNSYLFSGCIRLSAVNINVSSVSLGTYTFQNCLALTDNVVNEILKKTGAIPADTFTGCTGLTHVIIPNTITSIGQSAFNACSKLTAVTIQDGTNSLDIGNVSPNRVFVDCPITTLYLGRNFNVTYSSPFQNYTTLETVTVGANVTTLNSNLFSGCTILKHITSLSTVPPVIQESTFQNVPKKGNTLILPQGSEADYWATLWRELMTGYHLINYNAEGGVVVPAIRYVRGGDALGIIPTPTRINYEFDGWYTQRNGAGTQYTIATVITAPAELYACWKNDIPGTVTSVTVSPATVSVQKGKTHQFVASVTAQGGASTTVTWTVTGNALTATNITAGGLLTVATGETSSTLTVTATSTFDVTKKGTASVTVENLTSAAETWHAASLHIYPNPFTDVVRITWAGGNPAPTPALKIQVINAAGAIVHTQMITFPDETIRLEHLPAGVYFFRFENDGKTKTVKVVKL